MSDTPILSDYIDGYDGLAQELGRSVRTIRRWKALGEAPPCTRIQNRVLFRREAVREWLANHEAKPA